MQVNGKWQPVCVVLALGVLMLPRAASGQVQEPSSKPANPLGGASKTLAQDSAKRLFCLAVECESWQLFFKWLLWVRAIEQGRVSKKGCNPPQLGGLGPDTTDRPTSGTEDHWTGGGNNNIFFSQAHFFIAGTGEQLFASGTVVGSELILAGAAAHEVSHMEDEYVFKDGEPKTPADAKELAKEEVEGADCELKILNAFKAGKCVTVAELAKVKKELCDRIKILEQFKKDNAEAAK